MAGGALTLSFERRHETPASSSQRTHAPKSMIHYQNCRVCCVHAMQALRNGRNASHEGWGSPGLLAMFHQRDLQALGAYFCRIFLRLGDDDLSSSM
jgi:hypothetical protein